jgi:benzylsuccinate CoA-transferase BbsF subunit
MNDALAGITLIEFGAYAAGPGIGKYLANFGARVIHVEAASRPDGFRLQYPPYRDNKVGLNRSGCFATFNDSKLGVTVDLKLPQGQELARRLVARADLVLENMRPGVMAKLGLDYESLKAVNPGLIMLSTNQMGQTGPNATHPGFGSQLSSLSGFTHLIGEPDGPPYFLYGPYIDLIAVAYGGVAILAALDARRRTGQGAFIDLSQYEAGIQFVAPAMLEYTTTGAVAMRSGNRDRVAIPHGCYPCAGDEWCVLSCWSEDDWRELAREADHEEWLADARFATPAERRTNEAALNEAIAGWTRLQPAAQVMRRLQARGVRAAVVQTMKDLFEDPQLAARATWQRQDHPDFGPLRYRMVSYQLGETPGRVRSAAPGLGEHNVEVFQGWLGLSPEEYRAYEAEGVFS